MFFTLKEMELAREMHGIGLWKEPGYGDWFIHTPPDTLAKLIDEKVLELYYNEERNPRKRVFIWLPTWNQARQWLQQKGYTAFELRQEPGAFPVVRIQGPHEFSAQGTTDLECLYAVMLAHLQKEAPAPELVMTEAVESA